MWLHSYRTVKKCNIFEGSDMHLVAFLKSPSNIVLEGQGDNNGRESIDWQNFLTFSLFFGKKSQMLECHN